MVPADREPPTTRAKGFFQMTTTRPVAITMAVLALIVFGLVSSTRLPLNLMPNISYPKLTVRTEYEGAAPEEVESVVSRPIEEALGVVNNLVSVSSTSKAGLSDVVLEFAWDADMTVAMQEVREKLDRTWLPEDVKRPLILRYDPALDPIMKIALYGDESLYTLRRMADEDIRRRLEAVSGVAAVEIEGGLEEEIRVEIDERRLAVLNLDITTINSRLARENIDLAGGTLREGIKEYLVRTVSQFRRLKDIEDLIVVTRGGVDIRLRDVGRVVKTHKERDVITRVNGKESVILGIQREADANIVAVATKVKNVIFGSPAQRRYLRNKKKEREAKQLAAKTARKRNIRAEEATAVLDKQMTDFIAYHLPHGVRISVLSDQSAFIKNSIADVLNSAAMGGLLAIVVLFAFLRRGLSTIIIGLSIPISIVTTFGPMHLLGVSLNIMSLGGLALAVGMLVDNSIVVLESIYRCREEGDSIRDAAVRGVGEVGGAIFAATLTTIAVFFPIVFVEGVAGQVFGDMALTVVISLLVSLLVALFFIPMLASRGANVDAATGEHTGILVFRSLAVARRTVRPPAKRERKVKSLLAAFWVLVLPFELLYKLFLLLGHCVAAALKAASLATLAALWAPALLVERVCRWKQQVRGWALVPFALTAAWIARCALASGAPGWGFWFCWLASVLWAPVLVFDFLFRKGQTRATRGAAPIVSLAALSLAWWTAIPWIGGRPEFAAFIARRGLWVGACAFLVLCMVGMWAFPFELLWTLVLGTVAAKNRKEWTEVLSAAPSATLDRIVQRVANWAEDDVSLPPGRWLIWSAIVVLSATWITYAAGHIVLQWDVGVRWLAQQSQEAVVRSQVCVFILCCIPCLFVRRASAWTRVLACSAPRQLGRGYAQLIDWFPRTRWFLFPFRSWWWLPIATALYGTVWIGAILLPSFRVNASSTWTAWQDYGPPARGALWHAQASGRDAVLPATISKCVIDVVAAVAVDPGALARALLADRWGAALILAVVLFSVAYGIYALPTLVHIAGFAVGMFYFPARYVFELVAWVLAKTALLVSMMIAAICIAAGGIAAAAALAVLLPIALVFGTFFGLVRASYPSAISWTLRNRLLVVGAAAVLLWLSCAKLLPGLGSELIPDVHRGEFDIDLSLPVGTPLDVTDKVATTLEAQVAALDEVKRVASRVGTRKESADAAQGGENTARITVTMRDIEPSAWAELWARVRSNRLCRKLVAIFAEVPQDIPPYRPLPQREAALMDGIRPILADVPRLQARFSRSALFSFKTPIEIEIHGYGLDTLKRLSRTVEERLADVPGLRDVRSNIQHGNPEIQIMYNRDRLAAYGLNIYDVAQIVRNKIHGKIATKFRDKDRRIDVLVRVQDEYKQTSDDIKRLVINPGKPTPIPLSAVADIQMGEGPSEIRRIDQQRAALITANLSGLDLGTATQRITKVLQQISRPEGFTFAITGQRQEMQTSAKSLKLALALALLLVYIVMASQFESMIDPLVIMFTIPLALIGVVAALYALAVPISIVVFIGMIMLAGIVVNNAIVLVDYINHLRRGGTEKTEAIRRGCEIRLRPILMTATTTVLGLFPMALGLGEGAEIRTPLAITVIAGLISSTLLTLFVIPAMYSLLSRRDRPMAQDLS